jgi:hypothetical protein
VTTPSDVLLVRHRLLSPESGRRQHQAPLPQRFRSRGRSRTGPGTLFQPGLQADGVPPKVLGGTDPNHRPPIGTPARRPTLPTRRQTPRPRTRGASGRGVCVNVPTLPMRRSLTNALGPSGVTGPSLRSVGADHDPGGVLSLAPGPSSPDRAARGQPGLGSRWPTARARAGAPDHRPKPSNASDATGVTDTTKAQHQQEGTDSTTFTVPSRRNLARGYVTRRSTRPGMRQRVRPPGQAQRRSSTTSAPAWLPALPATQDGRHVPAPTSKCKRLLPLPPGRQALPGHLPARGMVGPAPCRARPLASGPSISCWRARGHRAAGAPQAAEGRRRRGRRPSQPAG